MSCKQMGCLRFWNEYYDKDILKQKQGQNTNDVVPQTEQGN